LDTSVYGRWPSHLLPKFKNKNKIMAWYWGSLFFHVVFVPAREILQDGHAIFWSSTFDQDHQAYIKYKI
jgi:hypothetical protein